MTNKHTIVILILLAIVVGCNSNRHTAQDNTTIQRPIQTEISEAILKQECLIIEAKMQQEAGNIQQALSCYQQILAQNDNCAAVHYELSNIQAEMGALDSALFHSLRATAIEPENEWYLLQLANIYEHRYDRKAVAATWEKIVAARPDRREYYSLLANAYLQIGDADHAIEALERMEKRWGMSEEVSLQKQKIWKSAGKPQNAIKELEKLAKNVPQDSRYSAMAAEAYMQQKDYKKAKIFYDQIAQQHPDDEYIHISLANYYKLTGDPQHACKELALGFRNPALSCTDKLHILSSFFSNEEFYDTYVPTTFDLVDTIIHYCDDSSQYALFYADIQMRREKYAEALPWIQLHLRSDSSQYEAWEALLICEWMDNNSQLEHDAEMARTLFPFHILPYYLLAVQANQRNDHTTALALLEKCKKLGFRNGYLEIECHALLGESYYRTEQPDKAWPCFEHCLKLQPDNIGIMNNYAYYLSEIPNASEEQLIRAEQLSRKTIEKEPNNPTYLDTYAWILHQMKRDREALPYMQRAIDNDNQQNETLQQHYKIIRNNQ